MPASGSAQAAPSKSQPAKSQLAKSQPAKAQPARAKTKPRADAGTRDTDRALRDLVGAGPSQLGVSGALRGRDADRPSPEELAEAERDLVIVRRNWTPDAH